MLEDLEHFATTSSDPAVLASIQEARSGLNKLVDKLDMLESGFDRIAERSSEVFLLGTHLIVY